MLDVVAPGAAHAQRVPVVEHGDALGADRDGHVEHHRLVPSSSSTNIVENTSPTGTWLAKTLRPLTR